MKRPLGLLLVVGIVGCGGDATNADGDPVSAWEKWGGRIERNEQREVVKVLLCSTQITDAGLARLVHCHTCVVHAVR